MINTKPTSHQNEYPKTNALSKQVRRYPYVKTTKATHLTIKPLSETRLRPLLFKQEVWATDAANWLS